MQQIIHIGFPKTATTTLQNAMLNHPDVSYLGKGLRDDLSPSLSLELARCVFFCDSRSFREEASGLRDRIATAAAGKNCIFVSDEAFSFAEYMKIGLHWQRQVITDHEVVAGRLAALFPGATVLMSIRGQLDFLKSFYNQSVKVEHVSEDFDSYVEREIGAVRHRSMLNALDYGRVHDAYAGAFGADRLHISIYEDYRASFEAYLRDVARLSGLDEDSVLRAWGNRHENQTPPRMESRVADWCARNIPGPVRAILPASSREALRNLVSRPAPPPRYSAQQREFLHAHFAPLNEKFQAITGLALPPASYPGGRRA